MPDRARKTVVFILSALIAFVLPMVLTAGQSLGYDDNNENTEQSTIYLPAVFSDLPTIIPDTTKVLPEKTM